MKNEIIGGDFPGGSNIDFTDYRFKDEIEISWAQGFGTFSFPLSGRVASVELMNPENDGGGLTPLEGGIIGGSVAGLDGFLAGYLSLSGDEDMVVFTCYLRDGRHFIARSNIEIYNRLQQLCCI